MIFKIQEWWIWLSFKKATTIKTKEYLSLLYLQHSDNSNKETFLNKHILADEMPLTIDGGDKL